MSPLPDHSAPYSPGSAAERRTVDLLKVMFNPLFIKADLNVDDKIPNIDGHINLTDEKGYVIGKLEAQVKTLPREHAQHPKFQCEGPFLKYCSESQLPVLLIVIDVENKVAYWQQMDQRTLDDMSVNYKGKSRVLHFNPANRIEENNNSCWSEWVTICQEDKLARERGKLFQHVKTDGEEINQFLKRVSDTQLGKQKPEFAEIHRSLDKYNKLLDEEFISIKQSYYYGDWKQGIAYDIYTDSTVRLYKYSVAFATNDTLIKSIPPQTTMEQLSRLSYFASIYENPVRRRPESFAYELIQKDIARMLEEQSFVLQNDYVGAEQIFHFIDHFYFMLRLEPGKHNYITDEVKLGFQFWLNKWVSCWHHLKNAADPVVDLDELIQQLSPEDIEAVKQQMFSRKYPENTVTVYSGIYNFRLINDTISRLRRKGVEHIQRLIMPVEWTGQPQKATDGITTLKNNYLRFHEIFPQVYDEFIKSYFPLLFEDLCYYRDFDKEMFVLNFQQGTLFPPKVHFWQMRYVDKAQMEHQPVVLVKDLGEKPVPPMTFWDYENGAKNEGKDHTLYWIRMGDPGAINFSQDFLLHQSLYKLLKQRFRGFFEKKLNNEGLSQVII